MEAARNRQALDHRGVMRGLVGVAVVIAITFVGSDRLVWFDAALTGYLFGVVFAVFGVIYLLLAQDAATRIARVAPAIEVVVVLAWATATFWFPLMVAIGVWRHVIRRVSLRYHPSYWALVFPLGMYGVATSRMIDATDVTALDWLPPLVFGIALSAWVLTSAGLVRTASRRWSSRPRAAASRKP